MTIDDQSVTKRKRDLRRLAAWVGLAALLICLAAHASMLYWRDFRHLGEFRISVLTDRINYDPRMLERLPQHRSSLGPTHVTSLRLSLVFYGEANLEPLEFHNIGGVTDWRPWRRPWSAFDSSVNLDIERNRLIGIDFHPQSDYIRLEDALVLTARICAWFLAEGFQFSQPTEPANGDHSVLDLVETGKMHPDVATLLAEALDIEDLRRGITSSVMLQRPGMYVNIDIDPWDAPLAEGSEITLQDSDTSVWVILVDRDALRIREAATCDHFGFAC